LSEETPAAATTEEPSEVTPPGDAATGVWPGLGALLAGLAGASVLVTGAALLIGWKYTEAFYGRLGVPMEVLDLEPADYLTAKIEIWYSLAAAAVLTLPPIVMQRFIPFRSAFGTALLVIPVGALTFVAGLVGVGETGEGIFVYTCSAGTGIVVFGTCLALWARAGRKTDLAAMLGGIFLLFCAWAFLSGVPEELGRHDAEALLGGPQQGSAARLVAMGPVGLPGERADSGFYITDAVQVVAVANSSYFLLVGSGEMVYSVPSTSVLRMEYSRKDGR